MERITKVTAAASVLGCVELAKLDKQRRQVTIKSFGREALSVFFGGETWPPALDG